MMDRRWTFAERLVRLVRSPTALLAAYVAAIWIVEILDTTVLDQRLQGNGIAPRRLEGLDGIAWAPWLHSDYGHVLSNTVPFLALGWLVSLRGLRYWVLVTLASVVIGGGLTWLLAGGLNHIGSSGVVFGYFGALLGGAFYDRRPAVLAPALVALLLYSGLLAGLVPQEAISWEGHLFGLVAGLIAARVLAEGLVESQPKPDVAYPWESDEPWLDGDPDPGPGRGPESDS